MANANNTEVTREPDLTAADRPLNAGEPHGDIKLTNDKETVKGSNVKRPGDVVFETLSKASAILITAMIGLIGLFLIMRTVPAMGRLRDGLLSFFTYSEAWNTNYPMNDGGWMQFGIPNLFFTTVLVSLVALIIAMPVALGVAIFLSNYCPKQLIKPLGFMVDLLAAVPSIVFGIWGAQVLGPALGHFFEWLTSTPLGGFILFNHQAGTSPPFSTSRNIFTGGVVLAIMILPVIAATSREVFVQTPKGQVESALALGATRWEVVKMTVLPFGMSGFISGAMLGLGRALGETMALYMVISPSGSFRGSLMDGGTTFATAIANAAPEFNDDLKAGAYIAAGLVLFVLTFIVNAAARAVVSKKGK